MVFPFLRLPRELRDKVYGYALQQPYTLEFSDKSETLHQPGGEEYRPNLELFLLSRDTYLESREVFYSQTEFVLDCSSRLFLGKKSCIAVLFFESRPLDVLPYTRIIELNIEVDLRPSQSEPVELPDSWDEVVQWLSKCGLQHLKIRISAPLRDLVMTRTAHYAAEATSGFQFILQLMASISQLKSVHRLWVQCSTRVPHRDIAWTCESFLHHLTYVRNSFLPANSLPAVGSGKGLRARYNLKDYFSYIEDPRAGTVSVYLDIDRQGKAYVEHEWRSRVFPDRWCLGYGTFQFTFHPENEWNHYCRDTSELQTMPLPV